MHASYDQLVHEWCVFLPLQVQLRDYPHPLLQGTHWRASGRMVLAEQEAQERGQHHMGREGGRKRGREEGGGGGGGGRKGG